MLVLCWCCVGVVVVLWWCCIDVVLVLHWCCIGVVLVLYWCCTGIIVYILLSQSYLLQCSCISGEERITLWLPVVNLS